MQKELIEKGYTFSTDSDTEVLVNGYQEWDEKVLDRISGMFSFFIYDKENNGFFAARDPIGVKPLYWAKDEKENYYFASEIKSLASLKQIEKVKLFPAGHFMRGSKLERYFNLPTEVDSKITEQEAIGKIRELFDHSIKIRVQTDLPVAVYLSGGIDSTTVLATARKYHNNITAVIIGREGSTDRELAVKYCQENNIKHIVGTPPTEKELSKTVAKIIKITESFEPNMVRQSTISYFIAKTAADNGFKVILCGEGSDEIFAGYPEFTTLNGAKEIENKITEFLSDLHRTQLQRVDRTSMHFTTEVREPFLDKDFLKYVLQIPTELKIKEVEGKVTTKYILRKAMEDRLPDYIYNRDKVVLSEGAGFKGNQKIGGLLYDFTNNKISDKDFKKIQEKYKEWNLETKEEAYYFKYYIKYGYLKAEFNQKRTTVNKTNTQENNGGLAEKILKVFNVRKFKREKSHTEESLIKSISECVKEKEPIKFVMYWGKGDRNAVATPDLKAIKSLLDFCETTKKEYEHGFELTLIFSDTHAAINGYDPGGVKAYFDSVKSEVAKYGVKAIHLSDLVKYDEVKLLSQSDSLEIETNLFRLLKESSQKHCRNFKSDYEIGAKVYYLQNQLEKQEVEKRFKDYIFLTYNGSELNEILPMKLPIFYMYPIKRGSSDKPWFS